MIPAYGPAWLRRPCSDSEVMRQLEATMLIGVPKEIKTDEYRVGLTPATVKELTARKHRVAGETMAGAGAGLADQEYIAAGGRGHRSPLPLRRRGSRRRPGCG